MHPADFESEFIKAGDSEPRQGLGQKQQQDGDEAALAHGKPEKRGLGVRVTGSAWDELLLPAAAWLRVSGDPQRLGGRQWGKRRGRERHELGNHTAGFAFIEPLFVLFRAQTFTPTNALCSLLLCW